MVACVSQGVCLCVLWSVCVLEDIVCVFAFCVCKLGGCGFGWDCSGCCCFVRRNGKHVCVREGNLEI